MSVSVSFRSRQYASGIQIRSGTAALYNKAKAAGIGVDSADSYKLKYNQNGTIVTIAGATISQLSATVNLAGATWHTGNGTADFLSWTNPETVPILISRVTVVTTVKSTGAATADIGVTSANNHTNSDTLLDGLDIGTATLNTDNISTPGTNGGNLRSVGVGWWVTFHANADPTGLVGTATIYYTKIQ